MLVELKYQVLLRNSNRLQGRIKAKVGDQMLQIKRKILLEQGYKSDVQFALQGNQTHVILNMDKVILTQNQARSSQQNKSAVRKYSEDSMFEESSFEIDKESEQFLQKQPQKPPAVRGIVQQSFKYFSCFSSRRYLQLNTTQLRFYTNEKYNNVDRSIYIQQIKSLKSYKKKQLYFLKIVDQDGNTIDLKFQNKQVCKEWTGYLMQSMAFNRYLLEKKTYSRADSFRKYMQTLMEEKIEDQLVTLDDTNEIKASSNHINLPDEKNLINQFKSMLFINREIIKLSQFQVRLKIGAGSFSFVYMATRNGKRYALKQLNKDKLLMKNQMKYAITELNVLTRSQKCKYIIPVYFAFQTYTSLYLALHYVSTGNLSTHLITQDTLIKRKKKLSLEESLNIISQIVVAIQFLHDKKILYRDLKPENVLIAADGHVYLTDFGLAKELNEQEEMAISFLGTPLYLAPQRFTGEGQIDYRSDVYGVGCIFYEMLHGINPFVGNSYNSVVYNIKNNIPDIDPTLPQDYASFIVQTLQKNPEKRIQKMSTHPIFKKLNWKSILNRTHKGIDVFWVNEEAPGVQIGYQIDQDYTQLNYPNKKIVGWQFNSEQ